MSVEVTSVTSSGIFCMGELKPGAQRKNSIGCPQPSTISGMPSSSTSPNSDCLKNSKPLLSSSVVRATIM